MRALAASKQASREFNGAGKSRTRAGLLAVLGVVAGLAGCGGDSGVQLNGKLFETAGLTGGKSNVEPHLAERAPLVPPPKGKVLPPPGEAVAASGENSHMAWPNDPDRRKAAIATEDKKALAEYCDLDKLSNRPEIERAQREADCRAKQGSLLSGLTSWLPASGSKKEGAASVTTEEGDPGIVTGSTQAAQSAKATKTR